MTATSIVPDRRVRFGGVIDVSTIAAYGLLVVTVGAYLALDPGTMTLDRVATLLAQRLPLVFVAIGQTIVVISRGFDLSVAGIVALTNVVVRDHDGHGTRRGGVGCCDGPRRRSRRRPRQRSARRLPPAPGDHRDAGDVVDPRWPGPVRAAPAGRLRRHRVCRLPAAARRSRSDGVHLHGGGARPAVVADLPLALGARLLAVGGDERAAYESGVDVARTKVVAFVLCGLFASIGGLFLTMQATSGDPRIGDPFTLNSIAAVALGGALFSGGRASVAASVAGALVLGTLPNVLFLAGVSTYWQFIVAGTVLVLAVTVSEITRRRVDAGAT